LQFYQIKTNSKTIIAETIVKIETSIATVINSAKTIITALIRTKDGIKNIVSVN